MGSTSHIELSFVGALQTLDNRCNGGGKSHGDHAKSQLRLSVVVNGYKALDVQASPHAEVFDESRGCGDFGAVCAQGSRHDRSEFVEYLFIRA